MPEVGLHGKVPARGDFVTRRLDAEFAEAWDGWLQRALAASREALGAGWLEAFLSAPVWRFLVSSGMYSRTGWVGVLLPSVDRVGRYFPLTLAAPIDTDGIDFPATLAKLLPWLDQLEALALEALTPDLDFEAFDRRVAALVLPEGVAVPAAMQAMTEDDTVPLGAPAVLYQAWSCAAGPPLDELLRQFPARASEAVWATRGGDAFGPHVASSGGPIPGRQFCALLDARWTEHAWQLAPSPSKRNVTYCDPPTPGVDLIHGQGGGEDGGIAGPLTATQSASSGNAQPGMSTGLEK